MGSLQDQYKDIKDEQAAEQDQEALKLKKKQVKAEKKKQECIARVDRQLTEIFNRLNDDKKILKALRKNNGKITQSIGSYNTLTQYFKSGLGFLSRREDIECLNTAIKNNKALKDLTTRLEPEGFSLSVSTENAKHDMWCPKFCGGMITAVSTALVTAIPFPMVAIGIGIGLGITAPSRYFAAQVILDIKEKPPEKEPAQDNALLDELNQQSIKTPVKDHIIK